MFESLFGADTPLAVRFFIAFVVVFALIGVSAWLIRRFGSARLGGSAARGRQPRLAVIEAGAVDGRRRLVLIRRDNVEHLLMIGGPADIVVEQNIVRGQPARETSRGAAAEPAARGLTAGDNATTWPLAPEPGAPRQRPAALDEVVHWTAPEPTPPAIPSPSFTPNPMPAAPAPRRAPQRSADTLAGLANELSRPASGADHGPAVTRTAPSLDMARDVSMGREVKRDKVRTAPSLDAVRPAPAAAPAAHAAAAPESEGGDQNLTEMAQRLEAALRRPVPTGAPATPAPSNPSLASAPRIDSVNGGARDKAAASQPAAAQPQSGDAAFGSLEQEMASLLGRPSGKA